MLISTELDPDVLDDDTPPLCVIHCLATSLPPTQVVPALPSRRPMQTTVAPLGVSTALRPEGHPPGPRPRRVDELLVDAPALGSSPRSSASPAACPAPTPSSASRTRSTPSTAAGAAVAPVAAVPRTPIETEPFA